MFSTNIKEKHPTKKSINLSGQIKRQIKSMKRKDKMMKYSLHTERKILKGDVRRLQAS